MNKTTNKYTPVVRYQTKTGRLFTIVGPSGVGKDTILDAALAQSPQIRKIKRVITRSETAGGEVINGVTRQEFERQRAENRFAVTWHAHGLAYGIPHIVDDLLAANMDVVFNGSRKAMADIVARFPNVIVLSITADEQTLRERLIARGRETTEQIKSRLARAQTPLPDGLRVIEIDNSGDLAKPVQKLVAVFNQTADIAQ